MKNFLRLFPLLLPLPATALTINFTDTTPAGTYPSFDSDGSKLAAIMAACKTTWQDIIEDSGTVNITYRYASISGLANGTANAVSGGKPTAGHINIDSDTSRTWYFDPTPTDNSEYEFTQRLYQDLSATEKSNWFNNTPPELLEVSYRGTALDSAPAACRTGFDMYTTALHEVGHVLGLSFDMAEQESKDSGDFDFDVPSTLANGNPFAVRADGSDPTDVNQWAHIAAASFMCNSCAATGLRRLPAATDVLAIAACSNWSDIDLPRQDFLPRQGVGSGSSSDYNNASNWIGNQVPGAADEASIRLGTLVGGGAGMDVNLTAAAFARSLFLSNASDLLTGAFRLDVGGPTTIEFDGNFPFPQIFVQASGELETDDLTINGGELDMAGGLADIQDDLILTADTLGREGAISGAGTVDVAGTLRNDGRITGTDEDGPTLTFTSAAATPWDLDGTSGDGEVYATVGNVTFASGGLLDAFDGVFRVDDPQTLTITLPWTLGIGGLIDLNGGDPDFATFAGGLITASGGVIDASGLSRFSAPITLSGTADLNCLATAGTDRLELDGAVTISGGTTSVSADSILQIDASSTLSGGSFSIAAGGFINLNGTHTLSGGTYTGAGELSFNGTTTIAGAVTVDCSTLDLDGGGAIGKIVNLNADLTINSTQLDAGNSIFDSTLNFGNSSGELIVNGPANWTMDGIMNLNTGATSTSSSVTGAPFTMSGTTNANQSSRWDAIATITGTINVADTHRLSLNGGDTGANPNRIAGGIVNGPGNLRSTTSSALVGHGTIAADIDFLSDCLLQADGGTLTLAGAFTSVPGVIGTADTDGTLNVVNAWTLPSPSVLSLNGGIVTGGTISNTSTISGFGTITANQLVNNGSISATGGQLLTINTTSNTDLDGTGTTAAHTVSATGGDVLISKPLLDSFGGVLNIGAGRRMEFASAVTLDSGGDLNMTGGTSVTPARLIAPGATLSGPITCTGECQWQTPATVGGTAAVNVAPAAVLRLFGNTTVNPGAAITGSGSVIPVSGTTLTLPDEGNFQPFFGVAGNLELGAGTSAAQVTVGDFAPTILGRLKVDLNAAPSSPSLNDLLTSSQPVALAGHLDLRFASASVVAGQRWTILSAPSVSGTFATVTPTGVPAGTALQVVYTATTVDVILIKFETLAQWIARHGLTPPNDSLTADPDKDGIGNDLEYKLGLNPLAAESIPPISGGIIEVAGVKYLSITARINTLCTAIEGTLSAQRAISLTGFSTDDVTLQSSVIDDITRIRTMTWRSKIAFGSVSREQLRVDAGISP